MKKSAKKRALKTEFWILKRQDGEWDLWEGFPSRRQMMHALKYMYRELAGDEKLFIPAIMRLERVPE